MALLPEAARDSNKGRAAIERNLQAFMDNFDKNGDGSLDWDEWTATCNELAGAFELNAFEQVYMAFDDPGASRVSKVINMFVLAVIFVSCTCMVLETVPSLNIRPDCRWPLGEGVTVASCEPYPPAVFGFMEALSVVIFTLEYLMRLVVVHRVRDNHIVTELEIPVIVVPSGHAHAHDPLNPGGAGSGGGDPDGPLHLQEQSTYLGKTLKFIFAPMNMVDLLAIAPFWIARATEGSGGSLSVLRVLRLARTFRVFKAAKYNEGLNMFGRVVAMSLPAMYLLLFFLFIGMVLFGSCIYFAESGTWTVNEFYPDGAYLRRTGMPGSYDDMWEQTPFHSIVDAFWWVIVTATTVGYGDFYPTTYAGKMIAGVTMVMSLLVVALPITVLGANFSKEYDRLEEAMEMEKAKNERLGLVDAEEESPEDRPLSAALAHKRGTTPKAGRKVVPFAEAGGGAEEVRGSSPTKPSLLGRTAAKAVGGGAAAAPGATATGAQAPTLRALYWDDDRLLNSMVSDAAGDMRSAAGRCLDEAINQLLDDGKLTEQAAAIMRTENDHLSTRGQTAKPNRSAKLRRGNAALDETDTGAYGRMQDALSIVMPVLKKDSSGPMTPGDRDRIMRLFLLLATSTLAPAGKAPPSQE